MKRPGLIKILVCILFSGGLLGWIISRLDVDGLMNAMRHADRAVLALAAGVFGLAIFIGAARWSIALQAGRIGMPPSVWLRAAFAGHFFNTILFGPAGGDLAKATFYSRWYPFRMHALLASAVVDRSFSVGGSILFGLLTLGLVLNSPIPGDLDWDPANLKRSGQVVLGLVIILVIVGVRSRFWDLPFFTHFAVSFKQTLRSLWIQPWKVLFGCLLGMSGQLLLSSITAICLYSLTEAQLPWMDLLWAFPLISTLAALPFTVGGSGLREIIAIAVFSRYGVPDEDIVAAGILTLMLYLFWAGVGGVIAGWEMNRHSSSDGNKPT